MGFRFVQLSASQPGFRPRELDQSSRRDLLASLRRSELTISGLDLWIPVADYSDSARVDRAIESTLSAIRLAADLGRLALSLVLPDDAKVVSAIAARASHDGIELADHRAPAGNYDGVGAGIDPAAWLAQNLDPAAAVASNSKRLVSARLCDLLTSGLRGPIGDRQEGRLDVPGYRVALDVAGYLRPVVVDARQWRDVGQGLRQTRLEWEGI